MTHLAHKSHNSYSSPQGASRPAGSKQQRIATDRALALAHRVYPVQLSPQVEPLSHYFGRWSEYLAAVNARAAYRKARADLFERAYHRLLAAQLKAKP